LFNECTSKGANKVAGEKLNKGTSTITNEDACKEPGSQTGHGKTCRNTNQDTNDISPNEDASKAPTDLTNGDASQASNTPTRCRRDSCIDLL
jgi:hypothetical protein